MSAVTDIPITHHVYEWSDAPKHRNCNHYEVVNLDGNQVDPRVLQRPGTGFRAIIAGAPHACPKCKYGSDNPHAFYIRDKPIPDLNGLAR